MVPLLLAACSGPGPDDSGGPAAPWTASLAEPIALTSPGSGALQTHATVAWGDDARFAVAFSIGEVPQTQAVVQLFDADGLPLSTMGRLNAVDANGDKPDIEWDGAGYVVAWSDAFGRVGLAGVSADGEVAPAGAIADSTAQADAVDLAVQPGGGGVAIWTDFGAQGDGPTDGRIAWRAFDAALVPSGPLRIADDASRKASDAAPTPDGGWVAVWAIEYDHPSAVDGVVYEVWGRLHRPDGSAWTFRADDLDTAYPSRPAVAVRPDGVFAVTWRDKLEAEGPGLGSGAYVRMFGPDGVPLGPSVAVGAGGDGDRVVVDWAGDLAVVAWQETDPAGVPGVVLAGVTDAGAIAVDRTWLSAEGDSGDERPSIAIRRGDAGGWDAVVVWEALGPGGTGMGLWMRRVSLAGG